MDHFFSSTVSQLCCPVDEVKDEVKRLTKDDVEHIRQLPSFMKYVESCPPEKIAPLLTDDDALKKETIKLLSDLHQYHTLFYPVLECLHTLVCKLPKHPLGKQLILYNKRE
ncbi:hypothetical protein KUTeg_006989 [Tegillarca granosa]|uniref:Origin recognition complex subunit 3 insertion domain-containing protein n=1 Tax=Tegillarca granosa TaxID=220873 RepID=A0ABQ9FBZ3_TEGGR|nr:hypothetical protein KUTeg_006989 [Tegillarca granosa]